MTYTNYHVTTICVATNPDFETHAKDINSPDYKEWLEQFRGKLWSFVLVPVRIPAIYTKEWYGI